MPEPETPQNCPHCGARLEPDESFCPDCGAKLTDEEIAVVKKPKGTPKQQEPVLQRKVNAVKPSGHRYKTLLLLFCVIIAGLVIYGIVSPRVAFSRREYCGDGYCNSDESCSNCMNDCGGCEEPPEQEVLPPETPPSPVVGPQITVTTAPDRGTVGKKIEFKWGIDAEEGTVAMSTALRYGTESTPGELGQDVAPADTTYVSAATAHVSTPLPGTFTSALYSTSKGTLYYRFHAVIDGKNYWSDEHSVEIAALEEEVLEETPNEETPAEEPEGELTEEPAETVPDYIITINDFAFSPKELTIGAGDTVQWKNNRTVTSRGIALLVRAPTSQGYFGWKSPYIYNGETYEYTFGEQGKLVYIEAVLTNSGVTGIITINP